MTDVVLLGFGIAGSSGLPVVAPLVSLAAFLAARGRWAEGVALAAKEAHLSRAMTIEIGLIALATLIGSSSTSPRTISPRPDHRAARLRTWGSATRPVASRSKVADLSTTVLTMTLTVSRRLAARG